jgi:hypothetical protein
MRRQICSGTSPNDPGTEKAQAEFEQAQKVEEQFHKDFDGQDFAGIALDLPVHSPLTTVHHRAIPCPRYEQERRFCSSTS